MLAASRELSQAVGCGPWFLSTWTSPQASQGSSASGFPMTRRLGCNRTRQTCIFTTWTQKALLLLYPRIKEKGHRFTSCWGVARFWKTWDESYCQGHRWIIKPATIGSVSVRSSLISNEDNMTQVIRIQPETFLERHQGNFRLSPGVSGRLEEGS